MFMFKIKHIFLLKHMLLKQIMYIYKRSLVLILAACLDPGSIPGISTKNTRYGDDWI